MSNDHLTTITALILAIGLCGWLMMRCEQATDTHHIDLVRIARCNDALRGDLIAAVGTIARQAVEITSLRAQLDEEPHQ